MTAAAPRRRGHPAATTLVDLGLPVGLYYGLRAAGVGVYLALLTSAAVPAAVAAFRLVRSRRVDGLALYVLITMLLGAVASALSGSPRTLLAREGWLVGLTGLWFIGSVWAGRPMAFRYSRPLLERRTGPPGVSWDELWERLPRFRRIWRLTSVAWGAGLLADAAVRVAMAYTLPVDAVPALGTALYVGTSLLLIAGTNVYYLRAGLFDPRSALYLPAERDQPTNRPMISSP